jgi:thymidylate synthase (FAD)
MAATLVWATPDAEKLVAKIARVSNHANENNEVTAPKLLKYLMEHKHWSPFEMVSACFEIECPRYVSHQLIRHRSFSFQEFSQRYAVALNKSQFTYPRLQDKKNRQNSIASKDEMLTSWWYDAQQAVEDKSFDLYEKAIQLGVAKELARTILPEMTMTRMYMAGTMRSWIHFLQLRCDVSTQLETRNIADSIKEALVKEWPTVMGMLDEQNQSS